MAYEKDVVVPLWLGVNFLHSHADRSQPSTFGDCSRIAFTTHAMGTPLGCG